MDKADKADSQTSEPKKKAKEPEKEGLVIRPVVEPKVEDFPDRTN